MKIKFLIAMLLTTLSSVASAYSLDYLSCRSANGLTFNLTGKDSNNATRVQVRLGAFSRSYVVQMVDNSKGALTVQLLGPAYMTGVIENYLIYIKGETEVGVRTTLSGFATKTTVNMMAPVPVDSVPVLTKCTFELSDQE